MKKEIILIILLILITINLVGCTQEKNGGNKTYQTFYVDNDGVADYKKIQDAIKNIDSGGTIIVRSGTYNEILKIDKSINLIGDTNAKISYNFNEGITDVNSIVTISANNCTITGFNIYFSYFVTGIRAIYISSANNTISFCNITNVNDGIYLDYNAKNNKILNCMISSAKRGIYLDRSNFNMLSNNYVTLTGYRSIFVYGSNNNIFSENAVIDNEFGIYTQASDNNLFYNNTLKNNSIGLKLCCGSDKNIVYNNNFIANNVSNAYDNVNNQWDNGTIGNYWDDYIKNYPNARQTNDIWDTPYTICDEYKNCEKVFDRYPVVNVIIN